MGLQVNTTKFCWFCQNVVSFGLKTATFKSDSQDVTKKLNAVCSGFLYRRLYTLKVYIELG